MTVPKPHVPPAMIEKAPVPLSLGIVGATVALNVNAPAVAPVAVFLTVTNPVFVVVLAGVVVRTGFVKASVAPVTVNAPLSVLEDPFDDVVTVTFFPPVDVPAGIVQLAFTVVFVGVPEIVHVIPPDMVTPLAFCKPLPLTVTATVVPRTPDVGLIAVRKGPTVNVTVLLVEPAPETVTFLRPTAAVDEIVKVAVTVVSLTTVTALAVTPLPDTVTVVTPVRLVPVRVTGKLVPRTPELGLMDVSVRASTVNVTPLLVPVAVVTVTVLGPSAAVPEIVKVAATCVELNTVTPEMVTFSIGLIVAPMRFVPSRVTCTAVPRRPELGLIKVSVGAAAAVWSTTDSIAPGSKAPVASGRGFPK
jgi:hypothetical protein